MVAASPLIAAGGSAIQGIMGLASKGKARRADKKNRKEQLKMLRSNLQSFEEQAPRQMTQLGEAQQGLEGGVADERVFDLRTQQQRARERLQMAINQAKRAKKAASAAGRLEVLGDIAGMTSSAASGLSELYAKPTIPPLEQYGAQMGAGAGMMAGPFGALGGLLQGRRYGRNAQLGLLPRY